MLGNFLLKSYYEHLLFEVVSNRYDWCPPKHYLECQQFPVGAHTEQ